MPLTLISPAFADGGEIPTLFTCEGDDINPPLSWDWVPEGTRSFALIVDDPDAPDPRNPQRTWSHWVLYNMDDNTREIPADVDEDQLPPGTLQGLNDWKRTGWGGPCPPIGRHRYFFRLYALSHELPDLEEPTREELLSEMEGLILESAELVGTYQKKVKT